MAPLPTIPGVFRVTLDWDAQGGISARNVFHVHSNSGNVSQLGDALSSNLNNNMFWCKANDNLLTQVTIIKLDGSSASQLVTLGGSFHGGGSGGLMPSTAGVLSIRTAQRGPRGRGRLYIGPCTEDMAEAGILGTTAQSNMHDGWVDFAAGMALDTHTWLLGVASYVHADFNAETSMIVDRLVGTQRRRQDQLR